MRAGVNYSIHVEIEVIKFFSIGIRPSRIDRYDLVVYSLNLVLDYGRDNFGVLVGQPSKGSGDTHIG